MHKWISDRLDDLMMPLLKAFAPGYRHRLASYRPARALAKSFLTDLARSLAPVDLTLAGEEPWRGYESQVYRFESPYDGGALHNRTVKGRLLHAGKNAPWVVVVPGYATGATPPYNYGLFQEQQGLALLQRSVSSALIDPPYHLSRKVPGCMSGEGFFSPDLQQSQEAVLQAALDVIALIRWLSARSGRPVGLWGTSLGGCIAGLAATQVDRLAGVALMEPLDNPGDTIAALPGIREIREVLRQHGVESSSLHDLFASVSPSAYRPALSPDRILFATADWDRVVNAAFQEEFWQRWGCPRRLRRPAGHILLAADRTVTSAVAETLAGWVTQPPR